MSKKIEFNKSLKEVTLEDLEARIEDNEMRIRKMSFAHTITPLENPMSIRALRRDVARMKTELNKRELGLA
jgi:large subunit ribosomal protein L29